MSTTKKTSPNFKEEQDIEEIIGSPVNELSLFSGGRNSKVMQVRTEDGRVLVAKYYFTSSFDPRDRMGNELHALLFLQQYNVDCIPKLLISSQEKTLTITEHIEGKQIKRVEKKHIDQAILFLTRLHTISRQTPPSEVKQPASEAFFSAKELIENIEERYARFQNMQSQPHEDRLKEFLQEDIRPELNLATNRCKEIIEQNHLSMTAAIDQYQRTLSPSDFGFHNAIEDITGKIYFLDFEYFGWDDPAKLICDFLIHPGMNLTDDIKNYFCAKTLPIYSDTKSLAVRIKSYYPLFHLKWCLILLNEFIRTDQDRRLFANGSNSSQEISDSVLQNQLNKAKQLFSKRESNYEKLCSYLP